jgi:uncharacterized DUF497 family protein
VVYEWNAGKAKSNLRNHAVSSDEGATVFLDPLALPFPILIILMKSRGRSRIGYTADRYVAFVAHCQRGDSIRIISARRATRKERTQYEEGIGNETRG